MKNQTARQFEVAHMKAVDAFADHARIIRREGENMNIDLACLPCGGKGFLNADGTRSAGFLAHDSILCSTCKGSGQASPEPTVNRIVSFRAEIQPDNSWIVTVVKEFAPEHGGGSQEFQERAGAPHHALDVLRGMVTMSPAQRTEPERRDSIGWFGSAVYPFAPACTKSPLCTYLAGHDGACKEQAR